MSYKEVVYIFEYLRESLSTWLVFICAFYSVSLGRKNYNLRLHFMQICGIIFKHFVRQNSFLSFVFNTGH